MTLNNTICNYIFKQNNTMRENKMVIKISKVKNGYIVEPDGNNRLTSQSSEVVVFNTFEQLCDWLAVNLKDKA